MTVLMKYCTFCPSPLACFSFSSMEERAHVHMWITGVACKSKSKNCATCYHTLPPTSAFQETSHCHDPFKVSSAVIQSKFDRINDNNTQSIVQHADNTQRNMYTKLLKQFMPSSSSDILCHFVILVISLN